MPMTPLARESRFRNAPDGRETFQSANPGHQPKHGIVWKWSFVEFIAYNSKRESLKYQAALGV